MFCQKCSTKIRNLLNIWEEFESEHNTFASMKIKNSLISPSGSSKQVIEAVEFLTKFKMGWYSSINSKGKEIQILEAL